MAYVLLFLAFFYFKIARVYRKEERVSSAFRVQFPLTLAAILALLAYGVMNENPYLFLGLSFLFFLTASMLVTAVQVGIFIDGKPMLGLSRMYRLLPWLSGLLIVLVPLGWVRHLLGV